MKDLVWRTGIGSSLLGLMPCVRGARVAIIRYHSTQQPGHLDDRVPSSIVHTATELAAHLRMLRKYYRVLRIDDVTSMLRDGVVPPPRSVIITFDDGYRDNVTVAAPLLSDFKCPATFFLTTAYIDSGAAPWFSETKWAFSQSRCARWREPFFGSEWDLADPRQRNSARLACNLVVASCNSAQRDAYLEQLRSELASPAVPMDEPIMMNWQEVRMLADAGHTIGSHSATHPNMALLSRDDAMWEAVQSRSHLVENVGVSAGNVFCYPNPIGSPNADTLTREVLRAAGYAAALIVEPGGVGPDDDLFRLRRIAVPPSDAELRWRLERVFSAF